MTRHERERAIENKKKEIYSLCKNASVFALPSIYYIGAKISGADATFLQDLLDQQDLHLRLEVKGHEVWFINEENE